MRESIYPVYPFVEVVILFEAYLCLSCCLLVFLFCLFGLGFLVFFVCLFLLFYAINKNLHPAAGAARRK